MAKRKLPEIDEIAIGAVGFSEFEHEFDKETGQPNSGTRQLIRDIMRDKGVPARKYSFVEGGDENLVVDLPRKKRFQKSSKEGD